MNTETTRTLDMDQILNRATILARRCGEAGVLENQLAMVLAHLKRHRSVSATLELLDKLQTSPFRLRTKSTTQQLKNLKIHVNSALQGRADWSEAAWIVGWACRLARSYGVRR